MKHTNETLKDLRDAIDAHLAGKPVEAIDPDYPKDIWEVMEDPNFFSDLLWRPKPEPKPEPKTRPWSKPDDVPGPVCWISILGEHRMVISVYRAGLSVGSIFKEKIATHIEWREFSEQPSWQYSTDRKTWQPCVVTE